MLKKLFLLAFMFTAILWVLPSCNADKKGAEVAVSFISCISKQDFEAAYELTSTTYTEEEFIQLYEDFFNTLEIDSLTYEYISSFESDIHSTYEYTLTYNSTLCGNITDDYAITIKVYSSGKSLVVWSPSLILPEMTDGDTIRTTSLAASRGDIIADRTFLAENVPVIAVSVTTEGFSKEDIAQNARAVSSILNLNIEDVQKKIEQNDYNGVSLVHECPHTEITDEQRQALSAYDGISVTESSYSSTRYYPLGTTLAHLVGYTTTPASQEEVDKLNEGRTEEQGFYDLSSYIGKSGIEQAYEEKLRGTDGYRIYLRSESGKNKRTLYEEKAQNGLDVQLTIDIDLQKQAERLLSDNLPEDSMAGAVIVMNPETGEIDALASHPTFDLNSFVLGMSEAEYERYNEMNAPFLNRALNGRYAPGSTYKPITASAALTYHELDFDYVFQGKIEDDYWIPTGYGTWTFPAIKRTEVRRRNSPLNMRNALIHSDNIYFANAALMLGEEKMEEYWNNLGLNERVTFDVPVSSSQYKSTNAQDEAERNIKTLADSGYGQGTMLVTPLQIACVYCAFANGGDIPVPYVVKGLYRENGSDYEAVETTSPSIWREDAVDEYICRKMTEMLKDVVSTKYNGTGQRLLVRSCTVAGKTGTAEVDKQREISWFIGYRTDVSDEDQRLVLVVLEVPVGDEFSEIKFTIARGLLELDAEE